MAQATPQETVLVVEDDAGIREFLRDAVLKPAGYNVITACNGLEGLERALHEKPDVILLDLMLPHLNGLDVLSALRAQRLDIPTIILTAHSSEQEILRAFRLGARDYLRKPFHMGEVEEAIANALAAERLRREKENLTQALAQANQRLKRQVYNWIALNKIAQAITSTLEESRVFELVMESVNRILQVEAGSLLLVDRETGDLEFKVTLHGDAARFSDIRLKRGQGIAGWVAEHGNPVLITDVTSDSRFYAQVDQYTGFQTKSILCVPLKAKNEVIGVLELINKRSTAPTASFTKGDLEMLTMLASWVAVAVENARLNRITQEMAASKALKQTVIALAHHVNNRLTALSLDVDTLERDVPVQYDEVSNFVATARRSIQEISAVVKALDQLEEIRTVTYVGDTEMIDIKEALEAQLRIIEGK